MRQEKEGIGIVKVQKPIRRKEQQRSYVLSLKGKRDIIGSIKMSADQKRNDERLCLTLKKAGKICLGTNEESQENHSKGSNKEPDK